MGHLCQTAISELNIQKMQAMIYDGHYPFIITGLSTLNAHWIRLGSNRIGPTSRMRIELTCVSTHKRARALHVVYETASIRVKYRFLVNVQLDWTECAFKSLPEVDWIEPDWMCIERLVVWTGLYKPNQDSPFKIASCCWRGLHPFKIYTFAIIVIPQCIECTQMY